MTYEALSTANLPDPNSTASLTGISQTPDRGKKLLSCRDAGSALSSCISSSFLSSLRLIPTVRFIHSSPVIL